MMKRVRKIDMAVEQLEDALAAYYADRFHSATVLAGAAEQLLRGYVLKHKGTPAWEQTRAAIVKIATGLRMQDGNHEPVSESEIGDRMNFVYNYSKHAGTKGHEIDMDAKSEAGEIIDRTLMNYDTLRSLPQYLELPEIPLSQRFMEDSLGQVRLEDP